MKKYLASFIIGLVWGLLFFLTSSLFSGVYGFPFYDPISSILPVMSGNLLSSTLLLGIVYIVISIPIFAIYFFLLSHRNKELGSNVSVLIKNFTYFTIGFFIILIMYLAIGLIAFSSGEFGL